MNTKDIEEMRKQKFYQYLQVAGFHKEAEEWFTQHRKAEVERAVEEFNLILDDIETDNDNGEHNVNYYRAYYEQRIRQALTPTTPDKQ